MGKRLNITGVDDTTDLNFHRLAIFMGYTNAELLQYLVECHQLNATALWQNLVRAEKERRKAVTDNFLKPRP